MSRLAFLSPDESAADVPRVSPLRHAPAGAFTDVSALGKLEVRGDVARLDGAIPIGQGRALLVLDGDVRETRDRLSAEGYSVYDMTGALAALDALPAIGSIARGTTALIERRGGERFRLFVPQELGQFVAEVVADMHAGLRR